MLVDQISDFILELEKLKIKLWVDDQTLRYKAPVGVVTKEILKNLGDRKGEIIEYLQAKSTGGIYYAPIQRVEEKEYYPLSAPQQRMFLLYQIDKQSIAYNLTRALKIEGELDKERLVEVIGQLVDRHESLRTSFEIIDDKPVQRIHKKVEFTLEYQELEDVSIEQAVKEFIRPYNLSVPPLFRYRLVKCASCYYLLQDMHHIISDGMSEAILVKEVNELYAKKNLPELKVQYKDYTAWHQKLLASNEVQSQRKYWIEQLQGEIPLLNLPTDFSRLPVFSYKGDSIRVQVDKMLTDKLNRLARDNRVTLYIVLLSAYYALISKYTGQTDIIVGTPTAGRRHADIYNIIGVFISTVVFRNYAEPQKNFAGFMKEVGENVLKAFDNQDYPFERLVEDLNIQRDLSRSPIFDTLFALRNIAIEDVRAEGLNISNYEITPQIAQFDISVVATENKKGIDVEVNYCTDLFQKRTMERLATHFINVLEAVTQNPQIRLDEIDILTKEEKQQVLYQFNDTYVEYQRDKTVHELFEAQVERTPDSVAVVFKDKQLTYRELNEKANQLARVLRQKGVSSDSLVGIMVQRSPEMIVGMMAVLKAGGGYLPIDPEYPEDRVLYMLEDSGARVLLVTSSLQTPQQDSGLMEIVDVSDQSVYSGDKSNLQSITKPTDLVYVIYTSGSTGKPKGVMLEHRLVVNFIKGITDRIDFATGKSILALTTISFDIHVLETLLPLSKGLRIVIADENEQRDSKLLNDVTDVNNVDMLQITPSRLQLLLNGASSLSCFKKLKEIMVGGEAFPLNLLNELQGLTRARIYNMYGPTETTVWSTVGELTHSKQIDIGKPIANTQILILDKNNNLQPIGVSGELCIAGDGLARGYLNRPELTAEKFTRMDNGQLIYHTGDMARWLPDGRIECIGRIDQQVKIRGYRIELGEIETHLLNHEQVKETVVMARDEQGGGKYLCAYIVCEQEISVQGLREYLATTLPDYMIPSYFIRLDQMPLTPNGKIDRKVLPKPDSNISTGVTYVAPTNDTEERLVKLCQEVLGVERIGVGDNFFDLGGHSLKAAVLGTRIHQEFNVEIPVREIFKIPTIKGLAEYIKGSIKSIYSSIEPVEERDYYMVSSAQKRLLILNKLEGASISYNMPFVLQIEGRLDKVKFEKAFRKLVDRHETMRTSFDFIDGEPVQRVSAMQDWNFWDYRDLTCQSSESKIEDIVKEFVRPFDLSKAPLIKVLLVRLEEDRHMLLLDMHHIISDGTSMNILIKEVTKLYEGKDLPDLRIQYKDFALWQNELLKSGGIKQQEEYWLEVFAGEIPGLNLPLDYSRPTMQSFDGDSIVFDVDNEITNKLNLLARETGATLYMTLLAAYTVLLHKYTGQDDIVVGSPIAGRQHADLQGIIGVFINMLAMRNYPTGDKTFSEFLMEVKQSSFKAYENQDYQFEELVEKLNVQRDFSRNPLFDTVLALQNMGVEGLECEGLRFTPYELENKTAKFDLTLNAFEVGDKLSFNIEYCTKLFKKETIQRLATHFVNILKCVTDDREVKLHDIDILTEEERHYVLHKFNDTGVEYEKDKLIYELFEAQVEKTPNNVAVVFKDKQLTYNELNRKANQLACVLRQKGVRSGNLVGIMVERSIEMIVGMIAVLKAGGAYLPIDPEYPEDRVVYMLEDSGARVLLVFPSPQTPLPHQERGLEILDITDQSLYIGDGSNLENVNNPTDLAYVIYTSGSTGKPKGVMLPHRSVVNFIKGITDLIDFDAKKSILALTTISFDIHVLETLLPLSKGVRIVIADENEQRDSKLLNDVIDNNNVDMLQITPSRLQLLLKGASSLSCLKKLKTIMVGGESFPVNLLTELKSLTQAKIYNMYGPTETTVWSTVSELTHSEHIDIGKPIANTQIFILDKNNKLQPIGVSGELCIAGDGLARGYFNRPELTNEKFVLNPFNNNQLMYRTGDMARWLLDGRLECLGRIDQQVKIRGYRIELGEIEKHLSEYEGVIECAVIAKSDEGGNKYLVAYYASVDEIAIAELRSYIAKSLPDYMVPEIYVYMERLPVTPNGKIDRKALPDPDYSRPKLSTEYRAAETETQKVIAEIWQEVLKREMVGVEDNFFELGGNSLLLVNMHSGLEKHYPGRVSVADIFAHPTILKLAQMIDGEQENNIKDMKIETLNIPAEYFAEGNNNDGTVIRFRLDNDMYKSLKAKNSDIKDILLGAFVYMFYEVSESEIIPLHTVDELGNILPIKLDLKNVKDIYDLIVLVGNIQKSQSNTFSIQHLRNIKLNKEMNSVLLLFSHNFNKLYSDHLSYYDIILKTEEENEQISCTFEYNSNVISKEKLEELAYYYISVLEAII